MYSNCSSVMPLCPTLQPHGLQHARHSCHSISPGVFSNSCPLSPWCRPTLSSSVISSSCPQSFPAPGSFPMTQLFFASGGQSIGASVSASILPISGLISFRIDLFDLLAVQGPLKSLLQHHSLKASIILCAIFFMAQLSHLYMTTGKTIALTRQNFVGKVISLHFNMLSRFVIAFLPRSKHLNLMAVVTSDCGAQENKICPCFLSFLSICPEVMGLDAMILVFWMMSFKPALSLSLSPSSRGLLVPLHLLHEGSVNCILGLLIFLPAILIQAWFIQLSISHNVLCI